VVQSALLAEAALKRLARELGITLRQSGDAEGSLSFNPDDPKQAMLAIRVAAAKRKRQLSPEQHIVVFRIWCKS